MFPTVNEIRINHHLSYFCISASIRAGLMRAVPLDQRLRHILPGGLPWLNETMTDIFSWRLLKPQIGVRTGPSRLGQRDTPFCPSGPFPLLPRLAALTGNEAVSGWCQIRDQTRPLSLHHDANHRAASTDRLCLRQQRSPCNSRRHERIRGAAPSPVPTKDAFFWPI